MFEPAMLGKSWEHTTPSGHICELNPRLGTTRQCSWVVSYMAGSQCPGTIMGISGGGYARYLPSNIIGIDRGHTGNQHNNFCTFEHGRFLLKMQIFVNMAFMLAREIGLHSLDQPSNAKSANSVQIEIGRRVCWFLVPLTGIASPVFLMIVSCC